MRISLIVTPEEHQAIEAAAQGTPLTRFILRIVMNNLMAELPKGNLLATDAERAKIKEQMKVLAPVPTIAGKAAYDPEDRLPDFVAEQPTEKRSGSKDQDVRRYEELPVGRRGAARGTRPSSQGQRSRTSRPTSRNVDRSDRKSRAASKCDQAVGPGLYCPKCDRRH